MTDFPEVSAKELNKFRILRQLIVENPAVLDQPYCPYDEPTRRWLQMAFAPSPTVAGLLTAAEGDALDGLLEGDWGDIAKKSRELYTELETLATGLAGLDIQEKIATVKVRASLLEKLVTVGERATNLKHINEFISETLTLMDTVLNADQRGEVIDQWRSKTKATR